MAKNDGISADKVLLFDSQGHSAKFFGSDAYPNGIIDMSSQSVDFDISQLGLKVERLPEYFHIIPEIDPDAAVADIDEIVVQFLDQEGDEKFTITANQLKMSAGVPMPYRIKKVFKTGTGETFSVVW